MFAVGVLLTVFIAGGSATTARDRAATNEYLAIRGALVTHVEQSRTARGTAVATYVAGIASTCAGALKGAPPIRGKRRYVQKGSTLVLAPRTVLLLSAMGSVEQTMHLADAAAIREFIREARGLRWTDRVLTRLVHALADTEGAELEQEAPELCREAHAWAASGYKSIPVKTSRAAERRAAAEEVLTRELAKQHCVAPYPRRAVLHVLEQTMSHEQRTTAEEISRLEARVAVEDAPVVRDAVAQIERVLGTRLQVARGKTSPADGVPVCVAVRRVEHG